MEEAGFEEIGVYILKRQNTAAQYIVTRPIMDLCKSSLQMPGSWVSKRRLEKKGIDLAVAREREAAAAEAAADAYGEERILEGVARGGDDGQELKAGGII